MNVLYFAIPIALLLGVVFLGFFIWATRSGQYDDLDTPSYKILLDDKEIEPEKGKNYESRS
ncbi:MAG: cbb3-type cytochrome oxidase assembly protein CcoS [Halobacteriovoraceae bacterium]|nr:cbb3-type cytochrome oxidase assembly protein CcoS [Halobacteriovoraceae bacterium]MCB9093935.1 cbb3-type cytochrome oxidase assembly protein CcoS [Halobacteriovoraceae bacterium]